VTRLTTLSRATSSYSFSRNSVELSGQPLTRADKMAMMLSGGLENKILLMLPLFAD